MKDTTTKPAPVDVSGIPIETVRASVALDLTVPEMDALIELCAANNLFRLGMQLAERKSRLRANVARMRKDLALIAQGLPPTS